MNVVGITAEYDPMHTGHIYHLGEARKVSRADFVVAVMSGDFTQRGEPALLDKWTRAKIAAENGADLVLELPFAYACNSAEYFAFGAMEIFRRLGVVTHVAFGAESPDLALLESIAELLRAESSAENAGQEQAITDRCAGSAANNSVEQAVSAYREALRRELAHGVSFAAARGTAIAESLGPAAGTAAAAPNNLLAIEYLKYMGGMTPVLVQRSAPHHADQAGPDRGSMTTPPDTAAEARITQIPESAGAIRRGLFDILTGGGTCEDQRAGIERFLAFAPVPANTREAVCHIAFPEQEKAASGKTGSANLNGRLGHKDQLYDLLMGRLLTMKPEELAQIFSVTEGMENRILDSARRSHDMDELAETIKTKRYPYTSVSRMLIHTLAGFEKMDIKAPACTDQFYGHILAASENGRKLLRLLKNDDRCSLPLFDTVTRAQGEEVQSGGAPLLALDLRAADLYNQATERDLYKDSDFVKHPFMG